MEKRELGNTGIMVSEVGFGAWQLANPDWGHESADESIKMVHTAMDLGCNFFDTAPGYGNGSSEKLLGEALRKRRSQVILCSKYGHHTNNGIPDYSPDKLESVLDGSLRRLKTDYLDCYLIHSPGRELMDEEKAPELYGVLQRLKQSGKIREYGVSVDWKEDLQEVLEHTQSKVVEVMYNAFHQDVAEAFPQAAQKGVGLIAKIPLDSGWLSGKYNSASHFDGVRDRWSTQVIERRSALVEMISQFVEEDESMTQMALQFCLGAPEISTVIPGAKSVEQVYHNIKSAERKISPYALAGIRELYESEIRGKELPW